MTLLFDPNPPFLTWCIEDDNKYQEHNCLSYPEAYTKVCETIGDIERIKTVGYVHHHGGEEIDTPTNILSQQLFHAMEKSIKFLPDKNDITLKVARQWTERLPAAKHVLICDTAFFNALPMDASAYAVPFILYKKGIRRYGGYGICHQWAWEQAQTLLNMPDGKLISIYLGNHTNIAAIKNGKPLETSIGFSPAEGILSSTCCGDIDPTVIFQLQSAGMSLKEINLLLSKESGFTGLVGSRCSYKDVVESENIPDLSQAREILLYGIKKYIGAFISILGGVDAIVFVTKYRDASSKLIKEILATVDNSRIKNLCLPYNKWNIINQMVTRVTI